MPPTPPSLPPRLPLAPPLLLNSASPWATTLADLRALHDCPATCAVTTRTALRGELGFPDDPERHTVAFFSPSSGPPSGTSSLNSYGYSPYPLSYYLDCVQQLLCPPATPPAAPSASASAVTAGAKPVIVSIAGSPAEVAASIADVTALVERHNSLAGRVAVEVNLSCPNLPLPPQTQLDDYLSWLPPATTVPIGLKLPPLTHASQFCDLVAALPADRISFVSAINTLGGCLFLDCDDGGREGKALLPGGMGGMGGAAIHPLALGNVHSLRRALDGAGKAHVDVIGVGGVADRRGFLRMCRAGAAAVGLATALGRDGLGVFAAIAE